MPQDMSQYCASTQHQDVDKCIDCPLCMEALDYDDLGFFPCSCGYQVCRFCWHRLKNDETGLCPACRQEYPDSPIQFSSISIEDVEELKKRKKKQKEKQKLSNAVKSQNLLTIRVVQKNLLFVIGLPARLSQEELRKEFAKYGKILKMVINSSSAYVTYTRPEDAVAAIKSLNDGSAIGKNSVRSATPALRASLGTTKYCTHWLRCQSCPKQPECMYLHEMAEPEASFTKEEMQLGKHTEYEKRLIQHYWDIINKERERKKIDNNASDNRVVVINGSKKSVKNGGVVCAKRKNIVNNCGKNRSHFVVDSSHCNEDINVVTNGDCYNDVKATQQSSENSSQSSSPKLRSCWGSVVVNGVNTNSSNSESNSNSLSSTPNTTPHIVIMNGVAKSESEFIANIDDNAMDATIGLLHDSGHNGDVNQYNGDEDDMNGDDDGLDFDPISISSRGLQDLLNDSGLEKCDTSDSDNICNNRLPFTQHLLQQQFHSNNSKAVVNSVEPVQHQQQLQHQHQQQHQHNQHPQQHWQQHQNSLRQLLPNVNITFQTHAASHNGSNNGFVNGFSSATHSQPVIANNHIRQQQHNQHTITHQLQSISGQLMGHPVITSAANVNMNAVNGAMNGVNGVNGGVSQYQNWTQQSHHHQQQQQQQQQQQIFRYQQQHHHQQMQRQQQQYGTSFYMGPMGSMPVRQPPPGF